MPIEFRCTHCQKLLRTPDDTAGKQAKCPECGTLTTIPSGTGGAAVPPLRPETGPYVPPPQGAGDVVNPYQSPGHHDYAPGMGAFRGSAPAGEIRPTRIDLVDVLGRTWNVFKAQWLMCLAGLAIALAVIVGAAVAVEIVARASRFALGRVLAAPLTLVLVGAQFLVNTWLQIGLWLFVLRLARGQQAVFADLFAGGPYLLRIVGATILYTLICFVGFLLLFIPGIILSLMFCQFYYLILDRNLPAMEALSMSRELTGGNKLTLFVIGLLIAVLGLLLVPLTAGLGLIVLIPFVMLLQPVVYLTMSGQPTMEQFGSGSPSAG